MNSNERKTASDMSGMAGSNTNDILLRIRSRLPQLSKKENLIAEFILDSPSQASLWGLEQISRHCAVSAASVSRFVNHLGFPSFKAFQVTLARSMPNPTTEVEDVLFSDESPIQVIRKVFKINQQGLAETESILDKAAMVDVAYAVARARSVVLFGLGGSGVIAKDGEVRLSQLGVRAQAFTDIYQMTVAAFNLTAQDVAIGISHSGQSQHIVSNARRARDNGALTVAITNYDISPLAVASDKVLLTSYRERAIHAATTSSHIAQLCMMDCLYFLVAQIKADEVKQRVDQLEEQINKEVR